MSTINFVYVYRACPKCSENIVPLKAWITPCDYDEDGHADGIEVSEISCSKCGNLSDEDGCEPICDMVIDVFYHMHDYHQERRPFMVEIGSIYSLVLAKE